MEKNSINMLYIYSGKCIDKFIIFIFQLVDENSIKKSKYRIEYKEQVKDIRDRNKKVSTAFDYTFLCSKKIKKINI